jgi:O-antigen/teichoic acid export membrane protein
VLVILLAESMPDTGVLFSWIIPMIVVILPANVLIFGRLLPRHMRAAVQDTGPDRTQIGKFFAADYLGSLFMFTTIFLVPVLVAARVEAHSYAYFFFAWSVATILILVSTNFATSMAVEGVYDESSLAGNCRSALRRALGLLVVVAVGAGLAAPYALGLVGPGYLDAAPLLQVLAFASLPAAVVEIYLGTLRARGRRLQIVCVQALRGVTVLVLVVVLLDHNGVFASFGDGRLTAVGVAFLLGQAVTLVAVLPGLGRLLGWFGHKAAATADETVRIDEITRAGT